MQVCGAARAADRRVGGVSRPAGPCLPPLPAHAMPRPPQGEPPPPPPLLPCSEREEINRSNFRVLASRAKLRALPDSPSMAPPSLCSPLMGIADSSDEGRTNPPWSLWAELIPNRGTGDVRSEVASTPRSPGPLESLPVKLGSSNGDSWRVRHCRNSPPN